MIPQVLASLIGGPLQSAQGLSSQTRRGEYVGTHCRRPGHQGHRGWNRGAGACQGDPQGDGGILGDAAFDFRRFRSCLTFGPCGSTRSSALAGPKFPEPMNEWQGVILLSFFGIYTLGKGVQTVGTAIAMRRR